MTRILTISMFSLLAACSKEATPAAKSPTNAKEVVLDGFRLGDSYAELMKRTPYQNPCDDDPVNAEKTTRAMVYGALPCREQTFANGTTLLIFLPFQEPDIFDKPIEAVAWLGGGRTPSQLRNASPKIRDSHARRSETRPSSSQGDGQPSRSSQQVCQQTNCNRISLQHGSEKL